MFLQCLLLDDRVDTGCILSHFSSMNYWLTLYSTSIFHFLFATNPTVIQAPLYANCQSIKLYQLTNISGCQTLKSVVESFSLLNKKDKNFECRLYQDQERFVQLENLRKQRSGRELFSRFVSLQNLLTTLALHSGNFPIPEINNLPNVRSYLMLMLMV